MSHEYRGYLGHRFRQITHKKRLSGAFFIALIPPPAKKLRRLDTRVIDQLGNPAIFLRVKRKKQTAHTDLLWLAG